MGKRRTFAEGHQTSEGRINADPDHIMQFLRHPVGDGVGGHFQDLVLGHAAVVLHEFAAGLHLEVGVSHGPAHDANFVFVLDQAKVIDQVSGHHNFGFGSAQTYLMQPAGPRLLDADARPIESALGHPLEDPAHPVHRAGKVEVRLVVLHPPGLDLINLQPGNEHHGIA